MCDLKVNEAKPTSRNVFILNHFALESKKESKYDKKNLLLGFPANHWPVFESFASEKRQTGYFCTNLVLDIL